jgi:hypothetical protein
MKRKKVVEPLLPGRFGRMDAAELDKEAAPFDQEFIADTAQAPDSARTSQGPAGQAQAWAAPSRRRRSSFLSAAPRFHCAGRPALLLPNW